MTDTLLDTNVLIDLSDDNENWFAWSSRAVRDAADEGELIVNQVIYSELAGGYAIREDLELVLHRARIRKESVPWDAAFMAGLAFKTYRRLGGMRRSPLPDFFIGAHAAVRGYRLLTRDRGHYATYFPTLDIVSPETHP